MQSKLEDLLKAKERELKLYQRYLDLRRFCEENVFPLIDLPLKDHVELLKGIIENIIPDPRDRTEELFSGEIFSLLGTIYLHDIGLVKNYKWEMNGEILSNLGTHNREIFLNYGIGKQLDIPEMAIEIINYLTFSNIVKKIPVEWEITEDSKKAIIRNTRVIEHIFNFSHLLLDIFYSDIRYLRLRRLQNPKLVLRRDGASVDINSREGIIQIKYHAKFPYELHMLQTAKSFVDNAFTIFKNHVNGRLGFQYKDIIWDLTGDFDYDVDIFQIHKFSPYREFETPPFNRQEEASLILDILFDLNYALVVGDVAAGKTTVLRSFIIPQMLSMTVNVFYCELWGYPVSEIRDVICTRHKHLGDTDLDIISLGNLLLQEGPCFFIIDACEKLIGIDRKEKEKFRRFIDFCLEQENIYLIISGDREMFFKWYTPFKKMSMSGIYEMKPIDTTKAIDSYKSIRSEVVQANLDSERMLEDLLKEVKDKSEFREVVAILTNRDQKYLQRYSIEDIWAETEVPRESILGYMDYLKEKDIVRDTEFHSVSYYSLTSRFLIEPLHRVLELDEFDGKREVRSILRNAMVSETFLDAHALRVIERWKDRMVFSKEEIGWILASLVLHSEGYIFFLEKAKKDGKGIDIQPLLRLIYVDDAEKRGSAIRLLVDIQDKKMINPLLSHLKHENVFEIKDLLVKGIGRAGKGRAIVAIMKTLREIGDSELRLRAIEFFYSLLDKNVKNVLIDIKEQEEDPVILRTINSLLSKIEEIP